MGTPGIQTVNPVIARQVLTPKQKAVFDFIIKYKVEHGYTPTLEDIGDSLGTTKITAMEHVNRLVALNLLYRERSSTGAARGRIAIVPQARTDETNQMITKALGWAVCQPIVPEYVRDAYRRWLRSTPT